MSARNRHRTGSQGPQDASPKSTTSMNQAAFPPTFPYLNLPVAAAPPLHQHATLPAPPPISAPTFMNVTGSKRRRPDGGPPSSVSHASGEWQQPNSYPSNPIAPYAGSSGDTPAMAPHLEPSPLIQHGSWQQQQTGPVPVLARASPGSGHAHYAMQPYLFPQAAPPHPAGSHAYETPSWPSTVDPPFPIQANRTSSVAGSSSMPYFPSHNSTEPIEVGPSAGPQFPHGREIISQYNYASSAQHHDHDQQLQAGTRVLEDASVQGKLQSLPILEDLATQLIHTLAKASFVQIQDFIHGSDSEECQAFTTLGNLFQQTRRVFSREEPFIDAIAIQMFLPAQQEIIRKANIATFISSILGAHDVSFFHLNEFFLETFVPHRLLKWQGGIFLELKTQAYISALINSDGRPEDMLDELFPADLDARILTRHSDVPNLSPSEQDFIDRSRARKSYLLAEDPASAAQELPKKYQWTEFVREFASCISKNVESILNIPKAQGVAGGAIPDVQRKGSIVGRKIEGEAVNGAIGAGSTLTTAASQPPDRTPASGAGGSGGGGGGGEPNAGRKASVAGTTTVRQAWTKPEEDALLDGLARVNGPHWSQILALYGRGGSISEVLKDRNQVQLKDKARNLKLWYLKERQDVPPALQRVTGELRKRGGARARAVLGMQDAEAGSLGMTIDPGGGSGAVPASVPGLGRPGFASGASTNSKKGKSRASEG